MLFGRWNHAPSSTTISRYAPRSFVPSEDRMWARDQPCEVFSCRHAAGWHQLANGEVVCMFCYIRAKRRLPPGPVPPAAYVCTFVGAVREPGA